MDCSAPGADVRESFGLLSTVSNVERRLAMDKAPNAARSIYICALGWEVDQCARGGMICSPET